MYAYLFLISLFSSIEVSSPITSWNTQEGIERLASSQHKVDFFKLANHFESQTNRFFCGPTSSAIVLNALKVRNGDFELPQDQSLLSEKDREFLPKSESWSPLYNRYTQNNVLDKSPKTREYVLGRPNIDKEGQSKRDFGLQLQQLYELLQANTLNVTKHVVDDEVSSDEIKQILIKNLSTADDYIIVNYSRSGLKQPGGGHISPLAAYHRLSDSFLILDTAPNKADWVWVKAESLISAMRTFDRNENRGFVAVKN
jgi:hypothetical protein